MIRLNTGANMPAVGLGTYEIASAGDVKSAVRAAIDAGYRHFDCAFAYGNEREVGEAIREKIAAGQIKRKDIFVTTKLWMTSFRNVKEGVEKSLKNLNLDYIDLYLMHWPFAFQFDPAEGEVYPKDKDGNILLDETIHYTEVWREMEKLMNEGLAKSIGISNFNEFQIRKLLESTSIPPAVHQFESHPYLDQEHLVQLCKSEGIAVTAYSPLGAPGRLWAEKGQPNLFNEPLVARIAKKYGKAPAQVILRYQLQKGAAVIPKSANPERMRTNFEVFDFELDESDVRAMRSLDRGFRACSMQIAASHKFYPFGKNYSE